MLISFHKYRLIILISLITFFLDQISKYAVIQSLPMGHSWPKTGFFRLTHIANTGSAFGLFNNQNLILTVGAFLGIGILIYFYHSSPNPSNWLKVSLGLVLSGAAGNLVDRLLLGHVTDFIDVGPWYIFNIADASIVTGMIVLITSKILFEDQDKNPRSLVRSFAGDEEYEG